MWLWARTSVRPQVDDVLYNLRVCLLKPPPKSQSYHFDSFSSRNILRIVSLDNYNQRSPIAGSILRREAHPYPSTLANHQFLVLAINTPQFSFTICTVLHHFLTHITRTTIKMHLPPAFMTFLALLTPRQTCYPTGATFHFHQAATEVVPYSTPGSFKFIPSSTSGPAFFFTLSTTNLALYYSESLTLCPGVAYYANFDLTIFRTTPSNILEDTTIYNKTFVYFPSGQHEAMIVDYTTDAVPPEIVLDRLRDG
ncbi:hypothetical protein G7Y89_g5051 [Cudoniella acicularis]|uniref:Uncharacterized protein n=1 Tax=Cudoniella acicularis TaxID=354080 RepID=A0A8H4RRC1_9HELO|nr:hypothetical protein G7Y89_g5051 [Cudoniella acicularis]